MKSVSVLILTLSLLPASAFAAKAPALHATAKLIDPKGNEVGSAHLTDTGKGVKIALQVKGLSPGLHGIHIHQAGKCEGPDFKSAGGHFQTEPKEHGLENPAGPHSGDLPNLEVKADGTARADFVSRRVTLGKGENSLLATETHPEGTALVIHATQDDQKSSPAGNSGDRVICGVIQAKSKR